MSNRVPLPAGTTLGKSFEYGLDVNLGSYGAPAWQAVRRMSAFAPTFPPITSDVTTYDDLGATNEDVAGRSFATSLTVQANRSQTTGLYLPEVEAIVAASRGKGEAAVLDIRCYHKPETGTPNPNDAWRALVRVELSRQNTGNSENEIFNITFTGKGEIEAIPNPFTGWGATAPVVSTVTPPDAATGEMVQITGQGFLGATAVTFDTLPADEFLVVNAATIIATLPADTAGAVPVVVTTPAGASAAYTYSRGA